MFVDREAELEDLARIWNAAGPQVYVLWGRRRIGKSALLRHFLRGKRHVQFQAAEVTAKENVEAFLARAADDLGRKELAVVAARDIEGALRLVTEAARGDRSGDEGRFAVVLDEFQNLLTSSPSTSSLIQRFVDGLGDDSPLRLFLCGSAVRIMEAEVLGERSPLYGRRTGQCRLEPLSFEHWQPFCPAMSRRDRLWVHAATGGIPAYLVHAEGARTAREFMMRAFFRRTGILVPEADFLLRTELSVIHTYSSILRAVVTGATRMQEIAERVGSDGKTVSRYLPTLTALGYVRRETSLDEPTPEKSRKGRYHVSDALLRFHFRFVQPFMEVIERGDGDELFEQVVAPAMPAFCGRVFEDIVRERLARSARAVFGSATLRSGRLYGPWGEIDLALELMDGTWVVGECKASSRPAGTRLLSALKDKVDRVPGLSGRRLKLTLASLGGFSPGLQARARVEDVVLVDADDASRA